MTIIAISTIVPFLIYSICIIYLCADLKAPFLTEMTMSPTEET